MMLFARREHPLDVTVQGPHDADPRKHCRAADCRDQDQGFHRRLPLSGLMLGLWKLRNEFAGVLERDKWRPCGSGIGSSNGRFQPVGLLREEIRSLLRECHIAARRVHRDIAVRDCGLHRCPVFCISASCVLELLIDRFDGQPARVVGFNPVRELKQLPDRGLGRRERAIFLEFH
jgi:hypothetical protein